ncbi:hypothetical protein [Cellulomonas alba]|uniref:Uncharacterized protein n=1 Tax=Cellulomonas alba TaxID=3053467 RepID=A0ABT7SF28_9CELL|nr:hypothetical protein [Cellulomonas alba]MDM7854731.1 hypothetical protein [Cellulomonas alba]
MWLALIVIGIVLLILGLTTAAHVLLWIGIILAVIAAVFWIVGRTRA